VIQEQERVEVIEPGPGKRAPRDEFIDIVAQGRVDSPDCPVGHGPAPVPGPTIARPAVNPFSVPASIRGATGSTRGENCSPRICIPVLRPSPAGYWAYQPPSML
jgi:hypothetical protein